MREKGRDLASKLRRLRSRSIIIVVRWATPIIDGGVALKFRLSRLMRNLPPSQHWDSKRESTMNYGEKNQLKIINLIRCANWNGLTKKFFSQIEILYPCIRVQFSHKPRRLWEHDLSRSVGHSSRMSTRASQIACRIHVDKHKWNSSRQTSAEFTPKMPSCVSPDWLLDHAISLSEGT